jgi:hypothetical protein
VRTWPGRAPVTVDGDAFHPGPPGRGIDGSATIDRHASDQIIPFASLADGTSTFQVPFITEHTQTAGWLAPLFLRAEVRAAGQTLTVHGQDAQNLRMDSRGEGDPPTLALSRLS